MSYAPTADANSEAGGVHDTSITNLSTRFQSKSALKNSDQYNLTPARALFRAGSIVVGDIV